MANPHLSRTTRPASPDINGPVETIKRERTMKLAGVLTGMALLVGGLFAVPYMDFRQGFDPGPTQAAPALMPDRGTDQATDTDTANNANQQPAPALQDTTGTDSQPTDQGERGAADTDQPAMAPAAR